MSARQTRWLTPFFTFEIISNSKKICWMADSEVKLQKFQIHICLYKSKCNTMYYLRNILGDSISDFTMRQQKTMTNVSVFSFEKNTYKIKCVRSFSLALDILAFLSDNFPINDQGIVQTLLATGWNIKAYLIIIKLTGSI